MAFVSPPIRFGLLFAVSAFVISSFIPIWTAWYFSDWEGLGVRASFWTMLSTMPHAWVKNDSIHLSFFGLYGIDLVQFVFILFAGYIVGWLCGRCVTPNSRCTRPPQRLA